MKLSKRLKTIISFINNDDRVLDVGCDHAYIDIYLAKNKKNKLIIASDISKNVIEKANINIKSQNLEKKIKLYCTSGTININESYDTIIIAGMGSNNILSILKNAKTVKKLIISSNNNWDKIRRDICKLGYYMNEEKLVYENNKLYSIIEFKNGKQKAQKKEYLIGRYNRLNKNLYKKYLDNMYYIYKQLWSSMEFIYT